MQMKHLNNTTQCVLSNSEKISDEHGLERWGDLVKQVGFVLILEKWIGLGEVAWGKWMSKAWGVVRQALWGRGSCPPQYEGGGVGKGRATGGVQGGSRHKTPGR